jgi:hypothetical protein
MPQDEALEGGLLRFIVTGDEPFQELRVGQTDAVPALKRVSMNRLSVPNRPLIDEILPAIFVCHSL